MHAFRSIVLAAAAAGLLVGLLITVVQQFGTAPLILRGEVYEQAMPHEHEHEGAAWEPADGLERTAYSAVANVVAAIGFALLLCGGYALCRREVDWRAGLLWGLAGYVVFVAAPSLGLPPKLPGMPTAELVPRQLWWIATAAATALALGLIAFHRAAWSIALALALLAAPHLLGAPQPAEAESTVPAELAHEFVVVVLLTGLLFWLTLGPLSAVVYRRLMVSPLP